MFSTTEQTDFLGASRLICQSPNIIHTRNRHDDGIFFLLPQCPNKTVAALLYECMKPKFILECVALFLLCWWVCVINFFRSFCGLTFERIFLLALSFSSKSLVSLHSISFYKQYALALQKSVQCIHFQEIGGNLNHFIKKKQFITLKNKLYFTLQNNLSKKIILIQSQCK